MLYPHENIKKFMKDSTPIIDPIELQNLEEANRIAEERERNNNKVIKINKNHHGFFPPAHWSLIVRIRKFFLTDFWIAAKVFKKRLKICCNSVNRNMKIVLVFSYYNISGQPDILGKWKREKTVS